MTNPLKGGFTQAEKQSISALHTYLAASLTSLHDASLDQGLRTSEIMGRCYTFLLREGFRALALLNQINIEQENTAEFTSREMESRAVWVSNAWFYLDRSVGRAQEYVPWLWGSAQTWLQQALAASQTIDRTLAYATPLPGDVMASGGPTVVVAITPTVVGPHGDQKVAQWCLHRAAHYFFDALDDCALALTPLSSDISKVVFQKGSELLRIIEESIVTLAGVPQREFPAHSERPDMQPRFLHVEKVFEWLTDYLNPFSTPFRYNEIIENGLTEWPGPMHAIKRTADSWRQSDRAAWNCFFFNFGAM